MGELARLTDIRIRNVAILNRVESRAPETARRLRGICGEVFGYAMAKGKANRDPTVALKAIAAGISAPRRMARGKLG